MAPAKRFGFESSQSDPPAFEGRDTVTVGVRDRATGSALVELLVTGGVTAGPLAGGASPALAGLDAIAEDPVIAVGGGRADAAVRHRRRIVATGSQQDEASDEAPAFTYRRQPNE